MEKSKKGEGGQNDGEYGIDDVSGESFLMFDCTNKLMKDLRVGDILMGEDSQPCTILDVQTAEEENYLVTPVKGETYIVGESHTLAVNMSASCTAFEDRETGTVKIKWFDKEKVKMNYKSFSISKYENFKELTEAAETFKNSLTITKRIGISVKEYNKKSSSFKHVVKGYKVSLDFEKSKIDIDPYILGSWLGDGGSRDPVITTIDDEIVEYYRNYFRQFNW